jgi:glycosyltransferase involved in cell wall biosynthesis
MCEKESKKRICFVSNVCMVAYLFLRSLMARLLKDGWEVFFLSTPDGYEKALIDMGFKFIPVHFERKGMNPINDFNLLFKLYQIYRTFKFDILLHYTIKANIYGSIAAGLSKTKAISTITGLGYTFMKDDFLCKFVKLFYRFALLFPRKVLFLNLDDLRLFIEGRLVQNEKTLIVPGSGVDVDYFSPQSTESVSGERFVFLFAGRFLWDKGLGELIEAFKKVKQSHVKVELWLLGMIDTGNPAGITEDVIRCWDQEGVIKYLGKAFDVRPFIAQSYVAIYPSYREGVPNFLLEAMAMEKPIITTDSVGCRDVIEDGKNGFMVKSKDVDSLVNAMIRMIALPEKERDKMGKYGREKAIAEFNKEKVVDAYLKTINELVG